MAEKEEPHTLELKFSKNGEKVKNVEYTYYENKNDICY